MAQATSSAWGIHGNLAAYTGEGRFKVSEEVGKGVVGGFGVVGGKSNVEMCHIATSAMCAASALAGDKVVLHVGGA